MLLFCVLTLWGGRARIKVLVVDSETRLPVPNVKIEGSFLNTPREWSVAAKDNDVDAWTDSKGYAILSGSTEQGIGGYRIYKNPGYYNVEWTEIRFDRRSIFHLGAWQPSCIVSTVRLDRVVSPIPLFVGMSHRLLCRDGHEPFDDGTAVLYDLLKNDWLPPWGNGHVGDISFFCKKTILGEESFRYPNGIGIVTNQFYRCDVCLKFIGDNSGMIEVIPSKQAGIKLRIAPEIGYAPERICWTGRMSRTEYKDNFDENRCYYFRIRVEHDEKGRIVKALYGKIYADFKLIGKKNGVKDVSFLYYLNPTPNDRNLEWDMKNNLCPKPGDIGNPRP